MSEEANSPKIASITIENFKGIGAPVTIPFKPITLLFGANSVGKSTVVEALLLAHEVLRGRNPDLDQVSIGSDLVRLGGFSSYVHGHDLTRSVGIRINCTLDGEVRLPCYESLIDEMGEKPHIGDIHELVEVNEYFIEFSIRKAGLGVCVEYTAGINGDWVVKSDGMESRGFGLSSDVEIEFNVNHPLILALAEKDSITGKYIALLGENGYSLSFGAFEIEEKITDYDSERIVFAFEREHDFDIFYVEDLLLEDDDEKEDEEESIYRRYFGDRKFCEKDLLHLSHVSSQLLVGARAIISELVSSHIFIGPFRAIPERGIDALSAASSCWADGSAAWKELLKPRFTPETMAELLEWKKHKGVDTGTVFTGESLLEVRNMAGLLNWQKNAPPEEDYAGILNTVNRLLKIIGMTQRLHYSSFRQLDAYGYAMTVLRGLLGTGSIDIDEDEREKIIAELSKATAKREILIEDRQSGVMLYPDDVGTGVSQVVPIVVGLLMGAPLFSVEQPELHLHPSLQCGLGDAFIIAQSISENVAIVETHSEHLLLRILRRMRETASNQCQEVLKITPDDVAVLAFEAGENGTEVYEMEISEAGELLTPWPNGFFPERMNEILGG